ncbi:hypothetical protein CyaNS01_02436 [Cyanobium sp. NS01]|nr:hypothetical protein CyaNS01_02436 [Cyanobium sp. NS01]
MPQGDLVELNEFMLPGSDHLSQRDLKDICFRGTYPGLHPFGAA